MAISEGYSSQGIQASSADWEICYDETAQAQLTVPNADPTMGDAGTGYQPMTKTPSDLLDVRGIRLANDASATGPVQYRLLGIDDTIVHLAPGDVTIVRINGRITKLEVKGADGAPVWSPCIFG